MLFLVITQQLWHRLCSNHLMFNFCDKIFRHVQYDNPTMLQILLIDCLQSFTLTFRTALTFSSIMPVDGHPERLSSTDVRPFFKFLNQPFTCSWPKVSLPNAHANILCVSAAVLPSLKQLDTGTLFSKIIHCKITKMTMENCLPITNTST